MLVSESVDCCQGMIAVRSNIHLLGDIEFVTPGA